MKKLFFSLAAIVALFATSCITEATSDLFIGSKEAVVSFSLKAPAMDSRVTLDNAEVTTIGNGHKAKELHYAVYDKDWKCLKVDKAYFPDDALETTITLRLVKNKTYNFVFWAQSQYTDATKSTLNNFYTVSLGNVGDLAVEPKITVNYNNIAANTDYRDAFFGQKLALLVTGTMNETVTLTRPFAQINFGTTEADVNTALEMGFDITSAKTSFTTKGYQTLKLEDGSVEDLVDVVAFVAANLPENKTLKAKVDATTTEYYYWVAMNYILWTEKPADQADAVATCTLTIPAIETVGGQVKDIVVNYPNAPANRNYRTNLVGQLLTEEANLKVIINPIFADEEYTEDVPNN